MRRENGFTLVEILVVCICIGLLGGMIWPVYRQSAERLELLQTAERLQSDLLWLKSRNETTGNKCRLQIQYRTGGVIYLLQEYCNNDGRTKVETRKTVQIPKGVQVDGTGMVFEKGKTYANQHIKLFNDKTEYYIYRYSTGRIRLSTSPE